MPTRLTLRGMKKLRVDIWSDIACPWWVGALHGDTFRVYALVGEARALAAGSEVWLSGQKVGKVTRISFQPVSVDTSRRILIEMQKEVYSRFLS